MESGIYRKEEIDFISLIQEITEERKNPDIGAFLTFIGITRRSGQDKKVVESIEMESYEEVASKKIKMICDEIEKKKGVISVKIFHLIGNFKVGEPLVFVAVTSKNRKQGILALEEAIQRYKSEPPLWKKEIYVDGTSKWISHA
jgi:molybdopterin synthase catalytic subunit